jgi:hypothetical protein
MGRPLVVRRKDDFVKRNRPELFSVYYLITENTKNNIPDYVFQ